MSHQDDHQNASPVDPSEEGCDAIEPLSDDELEDVAGGWDGSTPPPNNGGG